MHPQELIHEAARYKTWELLESRLIDLMVSGTVIDYKQVKGGVTVTLNGTTAAVGIPLPVQKPAPEAATPPPAAPKPPDEPKPVKRAAEPAKAKLEAVRVPSGVVSVETGSKVETETYEAHIRRVIGWVVEEFVGGSKKTQATSDETVERWFRRLRDGSH